MLPVSEMKTNPPVLFFFFNGARNKLITNWEIISFGADRLGQDSLIILVVGPESKADRAQVEKPRDWETKLKLQEKGVGSYGPDQAFHSQASF